MKNYKNKKNSNNEYIDKQDAFIQVNLLNDISNEEKNKIIKQYKIKESELKDQIYDLTEKIEDIQDENKQKIIDLKNEINSKKEEIIRLTNLNSKLKRNLEKMSEKVDSLYNKLLENKKLNSIKYNNINKFNINGKNNEINMNKNDNENGGSGDNLNEIIKIKDKQIKDSLSMITYLTREKNKLKEELFNLKDQIKSTNNMNNSAVINAKKKVNLLKTTNLQKFKLNNNQNDHGNPNLEKKSEKENGMGNENGMEADQNNKDNENINNNENDLFQKRMNYSSTIYKNILLQSKKNMKKRALSSANLFESKKLLQDNVHVKMNKLFNENERKALSTLFKSEEEFEYFNQKINVLHNHNSAIERKLLMKIKTLKIDNEDKDEQIQYLQDKLRETESKLKILENKLNYEKYILKQTKKISNQTSFVNSPSKKTFNSKNKDNKNSSFASSQRSNEN